jgi:hypothetical protein
MENIACWDVTPYDSSKNRRFGSLILSILMMEVVLSSETSVLIRATRRHIPEGGIHHSHRHENLKSYNKLHVKKRIYTADHIISHLYTCFSPIFWQEYGRKGIRVGM